MRKATRVISRQAKEGAEMASPWRPVPGPGEGGEDEHMLLQLREMLQQEQERRTQLEGSRPRTKSWSASQGLVRTQRERSPRLQVAGARFQLT